MRSTSKKNSIHDSNINSLVEPRVPGRPKMKTIVAVFTIFLMLDGVRAYAIDRWVDAAAISPPPGSGCGPLAAYRTIQDAVNAALPGDTIRVCAGVYTEPAPGPLT